MNLYLIERPDNDPAGYDEHDSAVVAANLEGEARMIHPGAHIQPWNGIADRYDSWVNSDVVKVTFIGTAAPEINIGVVCASFNAG